MYLIHELPPFLFSSALLTVCFFYSLFFPHLFFSLLWLGRFWQPVFFEFSAFVFSFFFSDLISFWHAASICLFFVSFAVLLQLTVTGLCVENNVDMNVDRSISLAFKRGTIINRTTENTRQPYSADLLLTYYMTTNQLTFSPHTTTATLSSSSIILLLPFYLCLHPFSPTETTSSSSSFVSVVLTRIQRLIVCHLFFFSCLFGLVSDRVPPKQKKSKIN